jgi:hypothetical protein
MQKRTFRQSRRRESAISLLGNRPDDRMSFAGLLLYLRQNYDELLPGVDEGKLAEYVVKLENFERDISRRT